MGAVLVEFRRGKIVESLHRGSFVVMQGAKVILSGGDPAQYIWARSAAKPVQGYTVLSAGVADRFGLSSPEIAVMVGSHGGRWYHVRAVRSMLAKGLIDQGYLRCGREGAALKHSCSGKHAGMLLLSKVLGADLRTYMRPGHPAQRLNLKNIARFAGLDPAKLKIGVDGCGVPTFGMRLKDLATMFSKMALECRQGWMSRIFEALLAYPHMLSWKGQFCSELLKAGGGRFFPKAGAEGVYGCAVIPEGIGIGIKVEDGSFRPIPYVLSQILNLLGLFNRRCKSLLAPFINPRLREGDVVVRVYIR